MFSLVEGSACDRQRLCFKFSRCSLIKPRHRDACTVQRGFSSACASTIVLPRCAVSSLRVHASQLPAPFPCAESVSRTALIRLFRSEQTTTRCEFDGMVGWQEAAALFKVKVWQDDSGASDCNHEVTPMPFQTRRSLISRNRLCTWRNYVASVADGAIVAAVKCHCSGRSERFKGLATLGTQRELACRYFLHRVDVFLADRPTLPSVCVQQLPRLLDF